MEKIYDAFVIVPLRKQMCFKDSYLSKDALEHMKEWNVSAEHDTHDDGNIEKCRNIDTVTESDTVIPIRITMDVTGEDFSDDWIVASPIIELDFNPINRWWPKDWFIDENDRPYDNIRINYKENVVLNLKYVKVRQEVINESFIDVITPTDELLDTNDELLQLNVEEGDKIMAFNKNKNKNNIEIEGKIEEPSEVIEVPAGSEPAAEIENPADAPVPESSEDEKVHLDLNDAEVIDVDLNAKAKSKKKMSKSAVRKVLKGTAITVGVSAIAVGAFFGIKAIVAAKRGDGDAAATVAE